MKFTNIHNLPSRVIRVINGKYNYKPPEPNRLSVTDLIDDELVRVLYIHHHDLIVRDYSDMLTMVQGTALHDRYEANAIDDEDVERKLEDVVSVRLEKDKSEHDMLVVGKADIYFDGTIDDVKQTGVYGPKYRIDKWTKQLNVYAWQRRRGTTVNSASVSRLLIDVWYRDWKLNKAYYKDYPPIPFEVIELELWPFDKQDKYVRSQVQKHVNYPVFDTPDQYEIPCSDKQRGLRWEAYKGKNKTPTKVGDTKEDVESYTRTQSQYKWSIRQSEPVFCNCYCKSRNICPFNKEK